MSRQFIKMHLDAEIYAAGLNNDFNAVVELYNSLGDLADDDTYEAVITAAGNMGQMDFAINAYNRAIETDHANAMVRNSMIIVAGNTHDFTLALDVYNHAIEVEKADIVTFNTMIALAGEKGRLDLALDAYTRATQSGQADRVTYNNMITAAGDNHSMNFAIEVYNFMVRDNIADLETFNKMIITAGNNGRMFFAIDAYNRAEKSGPLNELTIENFRVACEKNQPTRAAVYRHNPYSFVCNWVADRKGSHHSASSESANHAAPRQ